MYTWSEPLHHLCGRVMSLPPSKAGGAHVRLSSLIQLIDVFCFSLFGKRQRERKREQGKKKKKNHHNSFLQDGDNVTYVMCMCTRPHDAAGMSPNKKVRPRPGDEVMPERGALTGGISLLCFIFAAGIFSSFYFSLCGFSPGGTSIKVCGMRRPRPRSCLVTLSDGRMPIDNNLP